MWGKFPGGHTRFGFYCAENHGFQFSQALFRSFWNWVEMDRVIPAQFRRTI